MKNCIINSLNSSINDVTMSFLNSVHITFKGSLHIGQNFYTVWTSPSFEKFKIIGGKLVSGSGSDLGTEFDASISGHGSGPAQAVSSENSPATLIIGNASELVNINSPSSPDYVEVVNEIYLRDISNSEHLEGISSACKGNINEVNKKLKQISGINLDESFGDISLLDEDFWKLMPYSFNHIKGKSFIYSNPKNRASSINSIVYFNFPGLVLKTSQDLENYLVASAKCWLSSDIQKLTLQPYVTGSPTQLMKEACWYLKNKMYKTKGAKERTLGWGYKEIKGIDFSDIKEDPGWLD